MRFFFQAYSLYDSNFSSSTEYKPGRNLNNKKNHLSFSTSHFLQLCYSPGFIINSYNFLKTHTNKHIQSNLLLTANSSQRSLFYNGNLFWRTDHTSTVFFLILILTSTTLTTATFLQRSLSQLFPRRPLWRSPTAHTKVRNEIITLTVVNPRVRFVGVNAVPHTRAVTHLYALSLCRAICLSCNIRIISG